jgi:hypothetical protein
MHPNPLKLQNMTRLRFPPVLPTMMWRMYVLASIFHFSFFFHSANGIHMSSLRQDLPAKRTKLDSRPAQVAICPCHDLQPGSAQAQISHALLVLCTSQSRIPLPKNLQPSQQNWKHSSKIKSRPNERTRRHLSPSNMLSPAESRFVENCLLDGHVWLSTLLHFAETDRRRLGRGCCAGTTTSAAIQGAA